MIETFPQIPIVQMSKIILASLVDFTKSISWVDSAFKKFCKIDISFQAISGGGGWPLSVFLTPDLKPITGGTYFPLRDKNGRPGFITVLNIIAEKVFRFILIFMNLWYINSIRIFWLFPSVK